MVGRRDYLIAVHGSANSVKLRKYFAVHCKSLEKLTHMST